MKSKQYGFCVDADRCVICHACEAACKGTRGVELGVSWRKVIEFWQGEFPLNTRRAFSLSCLHCARPPCLAVCPTGAIAKRDKDGIVTVNRGQCIGCQECLSACPYHVPQFGQDKIMQKCDFCWERGPRPACSEACPTDALIFGEMTELKKLTRGKGGKKLQGTNEPSCILVTRRHPHFLTNQPNMDQKET